MDDGSLTSSQVKGHVLIGTKTQVGLRLNGQTLHPDHGYPARLIAPARPGVLQTKWVSHLAVQEQP